MFDPVQTYSLTTYLLTALSHHCIVTSLCQHCVTVLMPQAEAVPPLLTLAVDGNAQRAPAAVGILRRLCTHDAARNTVLRVPNLPQVLIRVLQSTYQVRPVYVQVGVIFPGFGSPCPPHLRSLFSLLFPMYFVLCECYSQL